jgi:HK97 family phage major capsid protein
VLPACGRRAFTASRQGPSRELPDGHARPFFPTGREGHVPITKFPAGSLGAGFAPEEWVAYVLDNLSAASVLLASEGTEIRTTGKAVHVPHYTGQASTAWYDEPGRHCRRAPPGNELTLTPQKVAALCTLSNEVVGDSNADVLNSVGEKMVRERRAGS